MPSLKNKRFEKCIEYVGLHDDKEHVHQVSEIVKKLKKRYILYIAFPEDPRIQKLKNLYPADDIKKIINANENEIHILAPLKLKTRRDLYKNLKKHTSNPIVSILYPMNYMDFKEFHYSHDDNEVKDAYSRMQPPVKTIDCDEIDLPKEQKSLYKSVMHYWCQNPDSDMHESKHHKETISEHIILVSKEIEQYFIKNNIKNDMLYKILSNATLYHDLGKYWTKRYEKDKVNFNNHENVSAVIFVSEMILFQKKYEQYIYNFKTKSDNILYSEDFDDDLLYYNNIKPYFEEFIKTTTQIILNHMFIKNEPVSEKALKRRQLTNDEIKYLKIFTEADNKGRII